MKKDAKKVMYFENKGYSSCRETYQPKCDLSRMILSFGQRSMRRKSFVFEDLVLFRNFEYEIHYTGKKSNKLGLVEAVYLGEEE